MNGIRSAAGVFVISKLKVPDELLISICDVVSFSIFHKSEYFNLNLSIETSAFNSLALASSLAFCSAFNLASALAFSSASANILSLFSASAIALDFSLLLICSSTGISLCTPFAFFDRLSDYPFPQYGRSSIN